MRKTRNQILIDMLQKKIYELEDEIKSSYSDSRKYWLKYRITELRREILRVQGEREYEYFNFGR